MPFYEYECSNCKFYVEALQKISDAPLKQCPSCKKQTLKKLVSAPNFRLKGGGWYETDFKSESEEKRNLADREEAAETKAEDTKEVKPEAKEAKEAKEPKEGKEAKPSEAKAAKPSGKPAHVVKAKGKPKPVAKPVSKPKPKAKAKPVAKKKKRR
jgi:putative FmdB family regulatory protein